jgi:hypothetical protein
MAGLPLGRKYEQRVRVLVLDTVNGGALEVGHVQLTLTGRMRVEPRPDPRGGCLHNRRRGFVTDQRNHCVKVAWSQHLSLREGEPEDRITWNVSPIDQLLDHIRIEPEWQHRGNRSRL